MVRQRVQHFRIDEHFLRLIESPDQILPSCQIDADLAADATVHLGQQGSRDLDERHAAQEAGSRKTCEIPDDASTQGNDQFTAVQLEIQQLFIDQRQHLEIFRLLAWRQGYDKRLISRCLQANIQLGTVVRVDVMVRDNGNLLAAVDFFDFFRKTVAQTIFNQDRVAVFAESYM